MLSVAAAVSIDALGHVAAETVMQAAAEYLRQNGVKVADYDRAAQIMRTHAKAAVGKALDDAKAALDCGMEQIARATFVATMRLAGIAAAKEIAAV